MFNKYGSVVHQAKFVRFWMLFNGKFQLVNYFLHHHIHATPIVDDKVQTRHECGKYLSDTNLHSPHHIYVGPPGQVE
jgi:hypothetical protein